MKIIDWLISNGEFIIGAMFFMCLSAIGVGLWMGVFLMVREVFL